MTKRFYLIDALRSSMIFIVLAHAMDGNHINDLISASPPFVVFIFNHGSWAVGLFFVISGFVVAHNLTGLPITGSLSLRFLARRSLRLDPTYWFAIVLSISIAFLSTKFIPDKELPHYSVQQIVSHVFYLQEIIGYNHIDPAYWTLCFEFQFYISVVAIFWLGGGDPLNKTAHVTRWILVTIALLSLAWPLGFGPDVPRGCFLPLAYIFFFGIFSYWAYRNPGLRAVFLGYSLILSFAFLWLGDGLACFCCLAALLLSMIGWIGRLDIGNWKVLQFLGLISYSVYLTHNPVSAVVFRIGKMLMPQTAATEGLWLAIDVVACVCFAYLVWFFVERTSTEFARRIKLVAPPIVALDRFQIP